jgi:hypothetical protein
MALGTQNHFANNLTNTQNFFNKSIPLFLEKLELSSTGFILVLLAQSKKKFILHSGDNHWSDNETKANFQALQMLAMPCNPVNSFKKSCIDKSGI